MKLTVFEEDGGVRGDLWLGEPYESRRFGFEVQWEAKFRGFHVRMDEEERGVKVHYGLHFISLWFTFPDIVSRKMAESMYAWADRAAKKTKGLYAYELDPMNRKIISFSEHDGTFWAELWSSSGCWSSGDLKRPPWLGGGWKVDWGWYDTLFGKSEYEKKGEHSQAIDIHMPEGIYRGLYTEYRCRWPRKRNPLSRKWFWRAEVEVEDGVPLPGKGTTSYNCGEDAIFKTCFAASDVRPDPKLMATHFASDALDTRERYSHAGWAPKDGWPEHCRRLDS